MSVHPLYAALVAAADGMFPPIDGGVEVCDPDRSGVVAVVEFTGHSFVLTPRSADDAAARGVNGYGGAAHPDVLRWLAGPLTPQRECHRFDFVADMSPR